VVIFYYLLERSPYYLGLKPSLGKLLGREEDLWLLPPFKGGAITWLIKVQKRETHQGE